MYSESRRAWLEESIAAETEMAELCLCLVSHVLHAADENVQEAGKPSTHT